MEKKKLLVTTPIYYVNWKPHIWHVYSSLIADSFARAKRSLWYDVKFSTWVDENSQKTVQKAQELWKDVYEYLDEMAKIHQNTWDTYKISYTDFIRTSSEKHKKVVQMILEKTNEKGYIYKWKYSWFYCVGCEAFKKEDELIEVDGKKVCPDHLKEPEFIEEENYFFKLTAFEDFLKNLYKNNPEFVTPESRFNEVKAFVEKGLEDFSISRSWSNFWIKFPFDPNHVVYVWYDALFNYYTVTLDDNLNELGYFNDNIFHVIWKDIAKFHAIYWPAMLEAVGLPKPKKIFTTGFFTVDWQKMSKSLWNVIDPIQLLEKYWRDAISLYLFYDIKIWKDWDFSFSRFEDIYNNILIGGWWNLVYRVAKLSEKFEVRRGEMRSEEILDEVLRNPLMKAILEKNAKQEIEKYFDKVDYQTYLKHWYELIQQVNKFIQDTAPWKLLKKRSEEEWEVRRENENRWIAILETSVWLIHKINLLWSFFFIESFKKINDIFDFKHLDNSKNFDWFEEELYKEKIDIKVKPEIVFKKIS